ncbi:MAG: transglycosylase SLT domain-containing protein [Bacteroidota bacterium]
MFLLLTSFTDLESEIYAEFVPVYVEEPAEMVNHFSFTVFSNDSVTSLQTSMHGYHPHISITVYGNGYDPQVNYADIGNEVSIEDHELPVFQASLKEYASCTHVLTDKKLYDEAWSELPQIKFWKKIMNMPGDSCLVNVSSNRKILHRMAIADWEILADEKKESFRDSIAQVHEVLAHEDIYITTGKKYYYKFKHVLPMVSRGVELFDAYEVDPWFAQAILLIESPGKMAYSPVGAYGHFQLMETVARQYGLIVNDSIDERADFEKAAYGAAMLIKHSCVPETKTLLRRRNISFNERDTWFRMLVLHVYHAGAGNVGGVLDQITTTEGGTRLMQEVWQTEYKGFKNASQNYSQIALASLFKLDETLLKVGKNNCYSVEPMLTYAP